MDYPYKLPKLNSIQYWFFRLVLQVGPGAPKASILWDFGLLDMRLRIWIEKVMLALHIRRMNEGTLAKLIFDEQIANKWPGLAQEADQICQELGIVNYKVTKSTKNLYKKQLVEACHLKNEELLKEQCDGIEKCKRIFEEEYGKRTTL